MSEYKHKLGWIGMGRMGYPMAERLAKAGCDLKVWNRTRSKAEPLAELGATIVDRPQELANADIVFSIVSTGKDLEQVYFGDGGLMSGTGRPQICVDCSSIGSGESAELRERLSEIGVEFVATPVSGNGKCVKAGVLSAVASGPQPAYEVARPYIDIFAGNGSSYVGEGELARFCKIAHNVLLGVVIQNICEITILAEKAGVPRHAFLDFINNSVMGSLFSRYKTPALVNLDWTTTFTPALLRKDLDLGLSAGRDHDVPMPVTAAAREALQGHFGAAQLKDDPEDYLSKDFSAILETIALNSGLKLESEKVPVRTGLEVDE